jgi:hypothetical protein
VITCSLSIGRLVEFNLRIIDNMLRLFGKFR